MLCINGSKVFGIHGIPLPLPLAPLVMVSQDAELAAVQAQPVVAVTVTVPVRASDVADRGDPDGGSRHQASDGR